MGEDHRLSGAAGAGGEPLNSELMPSSVLLELLDSFIEVVEVAFIVVGLVGTGFEEEDGAEEEEEAEYVLWRVLQVPRRLQVHS